MKKRLNFYKEQERWYADVPEFSKEENEMVFGADTFLERLSVGYENVTVEFSDTEDGESLFAYQLIEHDEEGGTYANKINPLQTMWLCNVTHFVFGEHPQEFFITYVNVF
jgi:hypothetical protein